MSQWMKCKVQIRNLEVFKRLCQKHRLTYEENANDVFRWNDLRVTATLRDTVPPGHSLAYLCAEKNYHVLALDSDPYYSSITERLGTGAALLMRDYTQEMFTLNVRRQGGVVNWAREQKDGSVLLKVSTAG